MWTQPPKFYDVIQSIQRLLEYTEGREYEIQGGGELWSCFVRKWHEFTQHWYLDSRIISKWND